MKSSVEELEARALKMGALAYGNNNEEGSTLTQFLLLVKKQSVTAHLSLSKALNDFDVNLKKRSNTMQLIAINRVLILKLFKLSLSKNLDVNNQLSVCSNNMIGDVWLAVIINAVVPLLIKEGMV